MIEWENIKSGRKGKAKNDKHFDRLNALSNGHLRITNVTEKKIKKSSAKVAEDVAKEAEKADAKD